MTAQSMDVYMNRDFFFLIFNPLRPNDMYVSLNYTTTGSDNGVSPVSHQVIIWTNTDLLFIEVLSNRFENFHKPR